MGTKFASRCFHLEKQPDCEVMQVAQTSNKVKFSDILHIFNSYATISSFIQLNILPGLAVVFSYIPI